MPQRPIMLLATILYSFLVIHIHGFVPFLPRTAAPRPSFVFAKENTGEVGSGANWIERSFPVDMSGGSEDLKRVEDYNLGISGISFQTGPLGRRMYDAILSNNFREGMDEEIKKAFTLYAMDFTAKEATKAALKQNGLVLALEDDEMQDEGMWGEVDSVQLFDEETEEPVGPVYDTTEEAVEHWIPGQPFSFIVRQVPAKIRELSLEELLQALDPKGELREQAEKANWTLPDENINSLKDLANDVTRRSETVPREATTEINAFSGLDKRGYRVISRGALSRDSVNANGSENMQSRFT